MQCNIEHLSRLEDEIFFNENDIIFIGCSSTSGKMNIDQRYDDG